MRLEYMALHGHMRLTIHTYHPPGRRITKALTRVALWPAFLKASAFASVIFPPTYTTCINNLHAMMVASTTNPQWLLLNSSGQKPPSVDGMYRFIAACRSSTRNEKVGLRNVGSWTTLFMSCRKIYLSPSTHVSLCGKSPRRCLVFPNSV